jgi:hypothetical protein
MQVHFVYLVGIKHDGYSLSITQVSSVKTTLRRADTATSSASSMREAEDVPAPAMLCPAQDPFLERPIAHPMLGPDRPPKDKRDNDDGCVWTSS